MKAFRARRERVAATYRAEAGIPTVRGAFTATRQLSASAPPAIEAPREIRLEADQLEQLAEILRRSQRPDE